MFLCSTKAGCLLLGRMKRDMMKRLLGAIIGIAVLIMVMISRSIYVFNFALMIICILGVYEFFHAFKQKGYQPISLFGYGSAICLFFVNTRNIISYDSLRVALIELIPILFFIMFSVSLLSKGKFGVMDVAITFMGITYVPFFLMFLTLTRQLTSGEYYVWYIFGGAWVTDTFAYLIGRKFGKHKFSKISPNKSIEGAIAGIIAAATFFGGYTAFLIQKEIASFSIVLMVLLGALLSVVSQVGDLIASSIKRYCETKDFGKILPGHGGVLDRFDSIIMLSPLMYILLQIMI